MSGAPHAANLPDADARRRALLDHAATLLVEAGAGSGKTALMAGRVALLLATGVNPREIVAITFTEAASSELRERIERFVVHLATGDIPAELRIALPDGLSVQQSAAIAVATETLDELVCTTIHGFCQQIVRAYPVEAGIDPGAAIIDPDAAELAYQDLLQAWLSARFGRDRGAEGLGRLPALPELGEEDFFAELLLQEPDRVITLIQKTALFLRKTRAASGPAVDMDVAVVKELSRAIAEFTQWYDECGVSEPVSGDTITDLRRFREIVDEAIVGPITGRGIAKLLLHEVPNCRHGSEARFVKWGNKGKWEKAATAGGFGKAHGGQLSAVAQTQYDQCSELYTAFVSAMAGAASAHFIAEFEPLGRLYADYKRQAALLDFDDLLYHARDLLARNEGVRRDLAHRYRYVLVDEFQDTDPLQAEILWRLCGEGDASAHWTTRKLRAGSLFVVGDPKQAIYRFRGADVDTYIQAKQSMLTQTPDAALEIVANFRSLKPIIDFANETFRLLLAEEQGQPGFTALRSTRLPQNEQAKIACIDITIEDRHKPKGRLSVDLVRREEALMLADILARMIGSYEIWDKRLKAMRPCRAGDIALLAPTGTSLWIYERALEQHGIPIASQAGKSFYTRQEIQDLIAVARTISDRRDTLALGALLRGPLVGLTEEEIADAIVALPAAPGRAPPRLHLWTDITTVTHPVLKRALEVVQNLARKARQTTPYQLMAEAIEELNIRPILRARYRQGAERALANVELLLEMARAYDARGIVAFADALRINWEDTERHIEGRPDADAEAVSISTMHSAKGLEWPIVIPINSPTTLDEQFEFLHHRSDNTVHFKLLGAAGPHYEAVKSDEQGQLRRERIRLWYVALTRACDLLILPRQSERAPNDWFSLLNARLDDLPGFDGTGLAAGPALSVEDVENRQDEATWKAEASTIAATRRSIEWRSPSRHEVRASGEAKLREEEVFIDGAALSDCVPTEPDSKEEPATIRGSRERGLVVHKLLEEVLTGETQDEVGALEARARALLAELGVMEANIPEQGPHASEIAASVRRALDITEVAVLRPRLLPEMTVFSAEATAQEAVYVGGVADALALDQDGNIDVVIDWKSDVGPDAAQVELYRAQVRDYMSATRAREGLLVFVTSGKIERVGLH